jgi:hypothetical protein
VSGRAVGASIFGFNNSTLGEELPQPPVLAPALVEGPRLQAQAAGGAAGPVAILAAPAKPHAYEDFRWYIILTIGVLLVAVRNWSSPSPWAITLSPSPPSTISTTLVSTRSPAPSIFPSMTTPASPAAASVNACVSSMSFWRHGEILDELVVDENISIRAEPVRPCRRSRTSAGRWPRRMH